MPSPALSSRSWKPVKVSQALTRGGRISMLSPRQDHAPVLPVMAWLTAPDQALFRVVRDHNG
jgi:hypothetical protein